MSNTEGFYFDNAESLMPFWRYVRRYKVEGIAARTELLRRFVAKKRAKYLRDVEGLLKGKNTIIIK